MKLVRKLKQLKQNKLYMYLCFCLVLIFSCKNIDNNNNNNCDYFSLIKIKGSHNYQLTEVSTVEDTICAIKELLEYKGDTNLIFGGVKCYNPEWAFTYKGDKRLSVQVFALHKINRIISDTLFFNTPFPVLIDMKNNKINSTWGSEVDSAYILYERFLSEFKKTKKKYNPLNKSSIKWYR